MKIKKARSTLSQPSDREKTHLVGNNISYKIFLNKLFYISNGYLLDKFTLPFNEMFVKVVVFKSGGGSAEISTKGF